MRAAARAMVAALLCLGSIAVAIAEAPTASVGPPEGFTSSLVLGHLDADNGGFPVAFAYAPDGRVFIARKTGLIDVYDGGVKHVFLDIQSEVNSFQSRGLLGLALDPDFAKNRRVYASFTEELQPQNPNQNVPAGGEIISIRAKKSDPNSADLSTRVTLLSGYHAEAAEHTIGALRFDAGGQAPRDVRRRRRPRREQRRITGRPRPRRSARQAHPHRSATGRGVARQPVLRRRETRLGAFEGVRAWASATRTGSRSTPTTARCTWATSAGTTWEMLNVVPEASTRTPTGTGTRAGPVTKAATASRCRNPASSTHPLPRPRARRSTRPRKAAPASARRRRCTATCTTATSRAARTAPRSPAGPKYVGHVELPGRVRRPTVHRRLRARPVPDRRPRPPARRPTSVAAGDWGNPVDIQIAPDGNVVYLAIGTSELREIVYTGANHTPVAVATAEQTSSDKAPFTARLDASGSSDADAGDTLTYDWDFADGSAALAPPQSAPQVHGGGLVPRHA